jgi:hypothetical protein
MEMSLNEEAHLLNLTLEMGTTPGFLEKAEKNTCSASLSQSPP